MKYNEKVHFRLLVMPCCKYQVCWVNPRLPTFCPECASPVVMKIRQFGEHTMITDPNAWLQYEH